MGRHAAKPSQKTRVRASRLCFRRGLAAQCQGEEACFRPRLVAGALQRRRRRRRSAAALFAGAQEEEEASENKKVYYSNATTTRTAARQPRPAAAAIPPPPPSLVTALHLAAPPPRRRRSLLSAAGRDHCHGLDRRSNRPPRDATPRRVRVRDDDDVTA